MTLPVTVTVLNTDGYPQAGLPVYAFDGDTYTGFSGTTDDLGDVPFTLPEGSYRFRADLLGTQFWSAETNHCDVPGCEDASIEITSPLVVTVLDTDGAPKEGLPVYAFDGETYTGFNGVTNASGEATFVLPAGSYRFRADLNGTQFWSGEANHCDVPGCLAASVTVTIPVTVSVQDQAGTPYPDLPVYAFAGDTYTGFNGISDAEGEVVFTLPIGDYRFRADLDGVQFWSGETTTCTVPGCTEDLVPIPGGTIETEVTIDYTYDPLYRLTAADYSAGEFFHYTYDAVGNRLTQETDQGTNTYTYDIANRLTSVDGVAYSWDDNGNLLSDGASTYTYDHANRLKTVVQGGTTSGYSYNGLGDRLRQTVGGTPTSYALDLAAGLTQVLSDGTNVYLYGTSRIGEEQPGGWRYHVGDALGSVRQLVDPAGSVALEKSYAPFGSTLASVGTGASSFAFAGEQADATGLVYLRARYLSVAQGRFLSRDTWEGDPNQPMSYNAWVYVQADPINHRDPTGQREEYGCLELSGDERTRCKLEVYELTRNRPWERPPELNWIPGTSLPLLPDIPPLTPEAQYRVPAYEGYPNFCGQLALAAILGLDAQSVVGDFHDWAITQPIVRDEYAIRGTTKGWWLRDYINERHSAEWVASRSNYYQVTYAALAERLNHGYLIPLVAMDGEGWINPAGHTPHWVVVTGRVSRPSSDEFSIFNWVWIFNPFSNAVEYYRWRERPEPRARAGFRQAWSMADAAFVAVDISPRPNGNPSRRAQ